MNELPWFKFTPDSWLSGVISDLDYETQGVFTSIMARYWKGGCILDEAKLKRRLRVAKARLEEIMSELQDEGMLTITDGIISIKFLDEQLQELTDKKEALSIAGKKGAEVRRLQREAEALLKGGSTNKNKDIDKEPDIEPETDVYIDPEDPFNGLPPNNNLNFHDWKYTEDYTQLRKLSCRPTEKTFHEWISLIEEHGLQSLCELLSDIDRDKRFDPNCIIIKPQFGSSDGLKRNANGEIIL